MSSVNTNIGENWGTIKMSENRYNLAGWLSICMAILFPLAFVIGIIQGIIGASVFKYTGPNFGPSDLLFMIFTAMGIYVLIMFRRLLHEHYEFHELDILITIAIIWAILFQVGSLAIKLIIFLAWPMSETAIIAIQLSFMSLAMIAAGVIDIVFAVKLFKILDVVNNMIKTLAYIAMISGILEVTVILSPLALFLIPISSVIYAMIFFKAKEEVEFV
jgi:hypothetical protein